MATAAQSTPILGGNRAASILGAAQFREIHKNTWLKRLTAEGRKITVGPKRSERSWVVFCVHDDTEALLEGYAEPRQAASHNPEWIVSMQQTLHISHALIPNSNEFEFVVTLSNEVVRFHATSWEIMQEWVETLRSKLREMKILSPRENLYTKLPEARPPLLPTRDPTSPLPAPPPVPAAIVPGVELVVPQSTLQASTAVHSQQLQSTQDANTAPTTTTTSNASTTVVATTTAAATTTTTAAPVMTQTIPTTHMPAMSNTLTQNLLNMLSDPITAYSEQLHAAGSAISSNEQAAASISTSLNNLQLTDIHSDSDEDCLSPLLRKSTAEHAASARIDIVSSEQRKRHSADQIKNMDNLIQCERLIPRPHTSRSHSAGAADKSKNSEPTTTSATSNTTSCKKNITAFEITSSSSNTTTSLPNTSSLLTEQTDDDTKTNITIIQVSTTTLNDAGNPISSPRLPAKNAAIRQAAEVFQFPETHDQNDKTKISSVTKMKLKQSEYKSNVQLIPSNGAVNSSTIKVLGDATTVANQYSTPVKKSTQPSQKDANTAASSTIPIENNKITTVHVGGGGDDGTHSSTTATSSSVGVAVYGTCYTPPPSSSLPQTATPMSTPKLPKKIILSANTSGITNITVDSANTYTSHIEANHSTQPKDNVALHNTVNVHYEQVFLSSSIPIDITTSNKTVADIPTTTANNSSISTVMPANPKDWLSPRHQPHAASITSSVANTTATTASSTTAIASPSSNNNRRSNKSVQTSAATSTSTASILATQAPPLTSQRLGGSPALQRRGLALRPAANMLTRGLTEAVITTRPSRRDFHFGNSASPAKSANKSSSSSKANSAAVNNNTNGDDSTLACQNSTTITNATNATTAHAGVAANRTISVAIEQRRRSSSTSDARATQRHARGANNNEFSAASSRAAIFSGTSANSAAALRIQQPPQPFRNMENGLIAMPSVLSPPPPPTAASPSKRLTLREQQVMQLRREIMHPGGVRLQLRRKDCIGSIAWVEAFGAVWVAGWKQKEHPVLYNALHIGDQLLSIAGVTITTAAEANKIIRNANTLFVEVLIRRMPFGRGYAIRRDREGQCLGLIRDGNTATIVDVVPNSLAARHGLPPKAQSCDGTTLTFWVLTEINGRPLNLFFKDTEIRDRLNSVGRDISILVQPADLITKLKKQLKSLRGYKDYLVQ